VSLTDKYLGRRTKAICLCAKRQRDACIPNISLYRVSEPTENSLDVYFPTKKERRKYARNFKSKNVRGVKVK